MNGQWLNWFEYMDAALPSNEGWKLLKRALLLNPLALDDQAEGLILGYTPKMIEFCCKSHDHNGCANFNLKVPELIERINNLKERTVFINPEDL